MFVFVLVIKKIVVLKRKNENNYCLRKGRVAIHHSDQLTPHINSFIKQWCAFVRCMTTDSEKHSAIEG